MNSIGFTRLDYHVASHYHADHIGCTDRINAIWPIQAAAFDRGTADLPTTQIYQTYANAVAAKRQTMSAGQQFTLDSTSANPVTVKVIAANGNGQSGAIDENDRSIALWWRLDR